MKFERYELSNNCCVFAPRPDVATVSIVSHDLPPIRVDVDYDVTKDQIQITLTPAVSSKEVSK